MWGLSTTLNIKKRGDFQYSIIPEDLLMRTFYRTKGVRDLLEWMWNTE